MEQINASNINLKHEWFSFLKQVFLKHKYNLKAFDESELSILFFTQRKMSIFPKPRKILISKEFECPNHLKKGFNAVVKKIENGESLRPHISKRINQIDNKDKMLFDWGIHHLHLGERIETDGKAKRTSELLFVRFDNDIAYILLIKKHKNWALQEFIKILHNNWPNHLKDVELINMIDIDHENTDDDVARLRDANINSILKMENGTFYIGPGGGITGNGGSVEATRESIMFIDNLSKLENNIKNDPNRFFKEQFGQIDFIKFPLNFSFQFQSNLLVLCDYKNDITINFSITL